MNRSSSRLGRALDDSGLHQNETFFSKQGYSATTVIIQTHLTHDEPQKPSRNYYKKLERVNITLYLTCLVFGHQ
jgi:hypothetical protein